MDMHFQVYWVAKQQSEKTDDLDINECLKFKGYYCYLPACIVWPAEQLSRPIFLIITEHVSRKAKKISVRVVGTPDTS